MHWRRILLGVALASGLAWHYCTSSLDHAQIVNTVKARGDQSAYLFEAQILYRNWHGLNDPPVVQPRNRMPLYPAFLASFWEPGWSDWEFFDIAKAANVYLSVTLLATLGIALFWQVPSLPAANLLAVIAFGYFVFKAGYTQAELLFYSLHLLTFVACWRMFVDPRGSHRLGYSAAAGVLGALAYLTKAATLPFAGLIVVVGVGRALLAFVRTREAVSSALLLAAPLMFAAVFLLVLRPYLATSKRIHGQYFYNVNTAALVWYDGYPEAAAALASYGPDGWPPGPRSMRPGLRKYWREHSVAQIAARLGSGFRDMAIVSFRDYMFLKPLVLYLLAAGIVMASRRDLVAALLRRHAALAALLVGYAALYLPATAFYAPTSGTGTGRFLLAHVAPLFFALTMLLTHRDVDAQQWQVGGTLLTLRHFHRLVAAVLLSDLLFVLPNRLMTTYGGF
jgi:hypothetical protein